MEELSLREREKSIPLGGVTDLPRWPICLDGCGESAARSEFTGYAAPNGANRRRNVAQHPVYGVFVEYSEVTVSKQIKLQRFKLQAQFFRLISDDDRAVIWQPSFRTNGSVFPEIEW